MKCCPKCFLKQEDCVLVCDCGFNFDLQQKPASAKLSSENAALSPVVPEKYTSLRTISSYFNLLAWLNLIGSIIVAVFLLMNSSVVSFLVATVWGVSVFVVNAAAAELIMLAIDIEENLRKMIFLREKKES